MEANPRTLAPGFNLLSVTKISQRSIVFYQTQVLLITFFAYAAFHASRKPPSIVKSVLGPEVQLADTEIDRNSSSIDTGWAPFDGRRGPHRLGELDLAFLSAYSIDRQWIVSVDRLALRCLCFGELVREIEERIDNGDLEFACFYW
ncbi:putative glycerol-3-phosphate transporter 5 [Macadamia integrifolia]|uniref:putative glycerol-3-phosphate transporter 5 n=1 Tax=Macadamia integrifolia TaxID=60698 RepID=UPI001C4F9137|nr:putative glycerol-3-phosphate transporter 5 [Macadamia integrifolia]